MKQKPIRGQAPLDPPSPEVAGLYLAEAAAVEDRREKRIDRRRMARLYLIDGVVLGGLITLCMFTAGASSSSTPLMMLPVPFFLWIQLSAQLRLAYGFQGSGGTTDTAWRLVVAAVALLGITIAFGFGFAGQSVPFVLRLVPGVAALLAAGWLARREARRAGATAPLQAPSPAPITPSGRAATAGVGVMLGLLVVAAAAPSAVIWAAILAAYIVVFVWIGGSELRKNAPRLGVMWRWPHWLAFAVGCGTLAVAASLATHTTALTLPIAGILGAGVIALFAIAATIGGRDG